jgi:hypothetical protein
MFVLFTDVILKRFYFPPVIPTHSSIDVDNFVMTFSSSSSDVLIPSSSTTLEIPVEGVGKRKKATKGKTPGGKDKDDDQKKGKKKKRGNSQV